MIEDPQPDYILETQIIKYSIYSKTKTACICGFNQNCQNIKSLFIPRSVRYESDEYLITSILTDSFFRMNVDTIQFASDSKLHTIEMDAFLSSNIESLFLPSSVINLEDGWCHGTELLNNIYIDPNNPRYKIYDNKSIIGKSSINQDNYDVFIFSGRNIDKLTIPNYIEIIGPYAFYDCIQINHIEIPIDSKLQIIERYAFTGSMIKTISLPFHLKFIGFNAFSFCEQLQKVEIQTVSELQIIDSYAFTESFIESIYISSQVEIINKKAFLKCTNFQQIEFSKDSKLKKIGKKAFYNTLIKNIIIPKTLNIIGESAFSRCLQLNKIEIPEDSELQIIEKNAFFNSNIESILIPSSLTHLCDGWCDGLKNLTHIKIMPKNPFYTYFKEKYIIQKSNPKTEIYDVLVFARRDIQKAIIPSFIKRIAPYAFDSCLQLKSIEFLTNSSLQIIDKFAFQHSPIESISIPSHVTRINEGAFNSCRKLKNIEITENSELNTIESIAFKNTLVESLFLPTNLVNLEEKWSLNMNNLINIDISNNNPRYSKYNDDFIIGKSSIDQQSYDVLVFARRDINKAVIPDFIKIIGPYAFDSCNKLKIVEMSENSLVESIEKNAFSFLPIQKIQFSPNLLKICENSFYCCKKLNKIEFPKNSKLQIIEKYAFMYSSITSISLPSNLEQISERAFDCCQKLYRVEVPVDSKLQKIDNSAFIFTSIKGFYMPQNLKEIDLKGFGRCPNIQIFELDPNSKIDVGLINLHDIVFETNMIIMVPVKSNF